MKLRKLPALCASILVPTAAVLAAPFYQENFNFDAANVQNGQDASRQTAWNAFRSNSRIGVIGYLKVVPGLSRALPAFNSNPKGPDDGYAFWSKEVVGLTVFTDEYTFNIASLVRVSYLQRLDGFTGDPLSGLVRDGSRLALRIRGVDAVERWYISDVVVRQKKESTWEPVDLDLSVMTFGLAKVRPDVGPVLPVTGGVSLPRIGVVTAFGVFIDEVNGRVRIDNVALSDNSTANGVFPQPIPTRAFTPGVFPTPDPDGENDPDPTYIPTAVPTSTTLPGAPTATPMPGAPTPTATPSINSTPAEVYEFCAANTAKAKRAVVAKPLRKKILQAIPVKFQQALRDRAIVSLVISTGIHFESLENVRVHDFITVDGKSYLNVYGSEKRPVRISTNVARFITEYIQGAGLTDQQSPLFRTFSDLNTVSRTAICTADIVKTLTSVLKKAGVNKQVRLIR